jgi:hypothetical protein
MGKISFVYLLPGLLLLTSCSEFYEEPAVEVPRGSMIAGKPGSEVEIYPGANLDGWPGNQHTWQKVFDFDAQIHLTVGTSYSSSSGSQYASSNIGGSNSYVQLAMQTVEDTLWACYQVNSDTTVGHIEYSNTLTPATCGGQLYFDRRISSTSPIPYPEGTRIDASLPWSSGSGNMYFHSSYPIYTHPTLSSHETVTHEPWKEFTGPQYVAFRLWSGDRFRYGYVKMSASGSTAHVYHLVIEK